MTTAFFDLSQDIALPRPAWPHRLFANVGQAIAAFRERRRTRRALANLSDHLLRDIGLDPEDVRGARYQRVSMPLVIVAR